jgi:hypothetical protein
MAHARCGNRADGGHGNRFFVGIVEGWWCFLKNEAGTMEKATPFLEIADFRGESCGFHVQVGPFGFPVVTDLGEDGGGGPQERS